MLTVKRVVIATICGVVFGFVCMFLASSNPNLVMPITAQAKWMIVIGRTMMGFMLGISALRLRWWLHGIVIGIIASIPLAMPFMQHTSILISTIVMGVIYAVLTELITSILFKAKPVGTLQPQ